MDQEAVTTFTRRITNGNKSQIIVVLFDMVLVDLDDATEGDGTNNIVKEMKRFTSVYDLGPTTLMDCHKLTVIDVSGVHRMWVKWCNCPNSRQEQENHLLQSGLFLVSYKNIKTMFTFKVLDDARLSNLECKFYPINATRSSGT